MTDRKTIFGFGALIYKPSLLTTAPNATDIKPSYIKGFVRSFSLWDAIGYTETNHDVSAEQMCALDVAKVADAEARVNGVVFKVSESDLSKLIEREKGYELIAVTAYDYNTNQPITHDCLVFSANKNDGKYVFDGSAQQRYLEDYLSGARQYGEQFYEEVLDTTYINGLKLRDVNELAGSL